MMGRHSWASLLSCLRRPPTLHGVITLRLIKDQSGAIAAATRWASTTTRTLDEVKITHLPGLEHVLRDELQNLGFAVPSTSEAQQDDSWNSRSPAVLLSKLDATDLYRLHASLGSASHIYMHVATFSARALGELTRKVSNIEWNQWILTHPKPPQIHIKAECSKSRLIHTKAVSERVHKGICESLGIPLSDNDSNNHHHGDVVVHIHAQVYRDKVTLWMDSASCGNPLHKRGYRLQTAKAPLREDIAYAMLYAAGCQPNWNSNSFDAFLDPFCGSGTIAIEAAAILMGLPPGRLRPTPLQGTPWYDPPTWQRLIQQKKESTADTTPTVFASDRDEGAIRITLANAERAGVTLQTLPAAFSAHPWLEDPTQIPQGNFLLASNLPYGRRLVNQKSSHTPGSGKHQHRHLYQKLFHNINRVFSKRIDACSVMLLTSEPRELLRSGCQQKLTAKLQTNHGGIKVTGLFTTNKEK